MPYPCTWKRPPCHRPRQTAGPSSRAPELTAPAPPGLLTALPYGPGDQPGVASAQDDLRYYHPHTLLVGAGLGEVALGSGPPGLCWVCDLGAYRTQGGAVDMGSDQYPSDIFLRPPGRPLAWEPGTVAQVRGPIKGWPGLQPGVFTLELEGLVFTQLMAPVWTGLPVPCGYVLPQV